MESSTLTIVSVCLYFLTDASVHTIPTTYVNTSLNSSRYRRQSEPVNCLAPPYPANGHWHLKHNNTKEPNDLLEEHTIVIYECNKGYKLSTSKIYICTRLWDLSDHPTCEPLCPPIYSRATYKVTCNDKMGNSITCEEGSADSILYYQCSDFFETPLGKKNKSLTCTGGEWKPYPKPECQPVCGNKPANVQTLAFNAVKATSVEYPWVTALYQKKNTTYEFLCGGSLISQSAVLTAAHCVARSDGTLYPPSIFVIGAGTIYRKYQDSREDYHSRQYINVYHIVITGNYKGIKLRYFSDIALLFTEKPFKLSMEVQPVCLKEIRNIILRSGEIGEIAGWGINENGTLSDELGILKIPYKTQESCTKELPPYWKEEYYLQDKMCAGFFNKNTSICKGDSGSGLVFKNFDDEKYYIHGIASINYRIDNEPCNSQYNSLYTKVEHYINFINDELSKNIMTDCHLPPHPVNGQWFITDEIDNNKKVGDIVFSHTSITFVCNKGYHLSPSTSTIRCDQEIKPSCNLTCPELQFPPNTIYDCQNDGKKINCQEADEYTTLTYICPEGFTKPPNATNSSKCLYNSWGDPKPSCIQKQMEPAAIEVVAMKKQEKEVYAIKDVDTEKEVEKIVPTPKLCYVNSLKNVILVDYSTSNLCTYVTDKLELSPEGNLEDRSGNLTLIDVVIFVIVAIGFVVILKLIYKFIIFMKNKFFIQSR